MTIVVPLVPGVPAQLGGVVDPTASDQAATKNYVDTRSGGVTITSPQSTINVGGTTSAPTIDVNVPAETLRINGQIAAQIGVDVARSSVTNASGTTNLIISSAGAFFRAVITVSSGGAATAAALNALGANATTIANAAKAGQSILCTNWDVDGTGFQVFCNFPSTVTQAQLLAIFPVGTKSNGLFYGSATQGIFNFNPDTKLAVDTEIANQLVAGTNVSLVVDATTKAVTINSSGGGSTDSIFNVGRTYIADNVGLLVRTTSQTPVQTSAAGSIVNIDDFGSITITSTPFPPTIPAGYNNYFLGISSSDNLTWGGVGRFSATGIDQISWIRKPSAAISFTNANLWILVATLSTVYSAVDENTAQTVTGPVSSILTPEATHVYADDGIGNKNDTITYQPFIDSRIATKIGSAPSTTYTNSGALSVGSGFGNAGTTCTFISTSYATAKAFLQTTAIGCTPPLSGLGNWTLPSWPVLISNIANPSSTQFATVTQIQESSSTSFLSITFTGNAAYFAGFTTQQPIFFLGNTAFIFQPNVVSGIDQITVASLNGLKGALTVAAGTGIGISTGTNAITVTNTGAGTPGSGNSIAFTNNQYGETLITETATESVYIQIGYTSSLEIGSGGTLGGVTYFDTTNQAATGAGLGIRTRVATTYTSLNPVFYTASYQVVFTTPAGASATDFSLDNLLFAKKTFTGNIYNNANLWPPFRDANVSDDIQLIAVKAPTFSVVSSGTNQWTATIGEGIWDASFTGYAWLTTDLSVEYVAYLRIFENSGVTRPPTGVSVTRTSGLGGIRLLASLPGTSGATPTLAQVLTVGNQTGAGRAILWQDNQVNTVSIAAPSTVPTSYGLKLPSTQGAANTALTNDGSGNLSWTSNSSSTTIYSTVPFKTTGGGQGFAYIEVSSLTGLNLAQVQSYFPSSSQYTVNRFFGTTDLLVLSVNGPVSQSGANFRIPTTGLGTFDIFTGDEILLIRSGSYVRFDSPLAFQPSNNAVGLLFDATLSKSTTSGILQIAQQGATNGQALVWNGTTWLPATVAGGTSTLTQVLTAGNTANNLNLTLTGTGLLATTAGLTLNGASTGSVTFKSAATVVTPYTLTFPTSLPSSAGQVLTSDLNGTLSWGSGGTGSVGTLQQVLTAGNTASSGPSALTLFNDATQPFTFGITANTVRLGNANTAIFFDPSSTGNLRLGINSSSVNVTANGTLSCSSATFLSGNTGLSIVPTTNLVSFAATAGQDTSLSFVSAGAGAVTLGNIGSFTGLQMIGGNAVATILNAVGAGTGALGLQLNSRLAASSVQLGFTGAANYVSASGAAAGGTVIISSSGSDTNVPLLVSVQGTSNLSLGNALYSGLTLQGGQTTAVLSTTSPNVTSNLQINSKGAGSFTSFGYTGATNRVIFSGSGSGQGVTIGATGETNITLNINGQGTGDLNLGQFSNSSAWNIPGSSASNSQLIAAGSASNITATLRAKGTASVVLGDLGTYNAFKVIGGQSTTAQLYADGVATNIDAKIAGKNTGGSILGAAPIDATSSYSGIKVVGGLTSYVNLAAEGTAPNLDYVLTPKGAGNFYPISNVLSATYQPKILVASARASNDLGIGAVGQALVSNGNGGSPFWGTPPWGPISTTITSTQTMVASAVVAVPFSGVTSRFNNLNLTISASGNSVITGWTTGATYLLIASVLSTNAAVNSNFYFSATSTNNIVATGVAYGAGVAAYLNRGSVGTTDTPGGMHFGYWTPAASTTSLYLYVYSSVAATVNTQLTIVLL